MKRRDFSREAIWLVLGGATIAISGCGSGSAATEMTSVPLNDAPGNVSENHGHSAVVTAAQLVAGGELVLDIRGASSHTHSLSLSASEVARIRDGLRVEKESSGDSHAHTVTFNG
jgi:hypothetical protein